MSSAPIPNPDPDPVPTWDHAGTWRERLGSLRNVVRQQVTSRQLASVLGDRVGRALDVGAGQGTQAIALAHRGWEVDVLDPDPAMRWACEEMRAREPAAVAARVRVWAGDWLTSPAADRPACRRPTTWSCATAC